MDCLERDAPINVMVQLLFVARNSPGLRRLGRFVRARHGAAPLEILPSGGAFSLPDIGTLRASYDVITDRERLEVLTLSLSECPLADHARCEADRLDAQSRTLQPLIAELDADETHWHLLPGPVDRADERRLARRAIRLLGRPVWSARPYHGVTPDRLDQDHCLVRLVGKSGRSKPASRRIADALDAARPAKAAPDIVLPANDLPALPRLRRDRLSAVIDALADRAGPLRSRRLTFQIGTGSALVMNQSSGI